MNNEPCRACDSFPEWRSVTKDFSKCQNCGVYKNNVNLLSGGLPTSEVNTAWRRTKYDIEKFVPVLAKIETLVGEKGTILDIACSYGYSLWLAKLRGWRNVIGVDVMASAAKAAKELFDVEVFVGEFEDFEVTGGIDCVVIHHGIEHLTSPKRVIEKTLEHLSEKGILWLSHPAQPRKESLARGLLSLGHQYEWTFPAFENFLNQFPVRVIYKSENKYKGGVNPPSSAWILAHG